MLVNYARCCGPIPGDTIVGFFTTGRGVVIHTADCPNTFEYRKHPDRWVHVSWAEVTEGVFSVTLRLDVENKRGVLGRLASQIAELESNINYVAVEERDGRFSSIRFTIEVADRVHLARIMRRLHRQPGVLRIVRAKG